MAVRTQTVKKFVSGTHNLLPDEEIPKDASSSSLNWLTRDGQVQLSYGRQTIGGAGAAGKNYGQHFGYKVDGTPVAFRKVQGKIQTLVGSTWTDVITGLSSADVSFCNYQSLAGAFVYIFSLDGIYKIVTANPTSYSTLYNSAKNFKGFATIDRARTILWGRSTDPTGLYGSYIDAQNSTVYTTVSAEATTSLSGTLAFKAGGATRTCFGTQFTITATGEVYTDTYLGTLTGSLGGTGTINYTSGAYTLSNPGVGTVNYQWEDSNAKGVTDFSKSATRLAGEGFVVRQDQGGDAIQTVLVLDGSYFSLKKSSCYRFVPDNADVSPLNEVFRSDIGVPSMRSAVATGKGIIFLNTANSSEPVLTIIQRNVQGDSFDAVNIFPQFDFGLYTYTDCVVDFWDRYVLVGCKYDSNENNRLLLCDILHTTVDVSDFGIRTTAKSLGVLYGGDPVSQSTYELFTGFDDLGIALTNHWDSNGEIYGADTLKKTKKLRFMGQITPSQSVSVYINLDAGGFTKVGTILGTGDYVDYTTSYALGTSLIGGNTVGGGTGVLAYNFFIELKIKTPKFRKRVIRFVADGIGFVSIRQAVDFDVWFFTEKMPVSYRLKQNVSLNGQTTNQATPTF